MTNLPDAERIPQMSRKFEGQVKQRNEQIAKARKERDKQIEKAKKERYEQIQKAKERFEKATKERDEVITWLNKEIAKLEWVVEVYERRYDAEEKKLVMMNRKKTAWNLRLTGGRRRGRVWCGR